MPWYRWQGIDETGSLKSGSMWAPSPTFLKKNLNEQSIALVQAVSSWEFSRISSRSRDAFFEHLSSLLCSQVPLYQALCVLAEFPLSAQLKKRIEFIARRISQGIALSEALEEQKLSDPLCHALLLVGESTGDLGQVVAQYVQYRKHQAQVREAFFQSLMMPVITFCMFLAISCVLLVYIVPLFDTYISMHALSVGASTRWLLWLSRQCTWKLVLRLLTVCTSSAFLCLCLHKTVSGSYLLERLFLKIPGVGTLYGKLYAGRTLQTVGMLLEQRVALSTALHIAALTVPYKTYQDQLFEVKNSLERGISLEKSWEQARFSQGAGRGFIRIGECSGTLSAMLLRAAEQVHKELSHTLSLLTKLMNPLLLLILASLIGSLAYSLYMPLIGLSQGLLI